MFAVSSGLQRPTKPMLNNVNMNFTSLSLKGQTNATFFRCAQGGKPSNMTHRKSV